MGEQRGKGAVINYCTRIELFVGICNPMDSRA